MGDRALSAIVWYPARAHASVPRPLFWRALDRINQWVCGLRGHEMVLHYEPDRLSLRCFSCGAATTGWVLETRPAFRAARPRLVARTARPVLYPAAA
jgi:hypothetical protein